MSERGESMLGISIGEDMFSHSWNMELEDGELGAEEEGMAGIG